MRRTLTTLFLIVLAILLIVIGLSIIIGPKFPEGPIHIRIVPGHAITTQDIVALVPLLSGVIILLGLLWTLRPRFLRYLHANPGQASSRIFVVGIFVGILIGILIGFIFERQIAIFLRDISRPIDGFFQSLGLI